MLSVVCLLSGGGGFSCSNQLPHGQGQLCKYLQEDEAQSSGMCVLSVWYSVGISCSNYANIYEKMKHSHEVCVCCLFWVFCVGFFVVPASASQLVNEVCGMYHLVWKE